MTYVKVQNRITLEGVQQDGDSGKRLELKDLLLGTRQATFV